MTNCSAESEIRRSLTVLFVGYTLGALIIGYFADRFGRKPATVISTFGMCFFMIGLSTSTNLKEFTIWYFLQAVTANACTNMQLLLMCEIVSDKQRAIPGVLVNMMCGLSCVVYAGFGSIFPKWYELFRFIGFLSLGVTVVISWYMPRSVKWLALNMSGSELEKKNADYLNKFRGKLDRNVENVCLKEEIQQLDEKSDLKTITQSDDLSWKSLLCSKMLRTRVFMASILWSTANITYYGFTMNIDSMEGNLYENMLINGIVEMVATFVPIFILTKYGRIHSQFTWLSLIVVPSVFGLFLEDSEYITVVRWVGKIGSSAIFAHIYVHTPEFFPTNFRGKGLGIPDGFSRLTAMVTPFLGMLYKKQPVGYWTPNVSLAVACIVVTFVHARNEGY